MMKRMAIFCNFIFKILPHLNDFIIHGDMQFYEPAERLKICYISSHT